jgi:hypothetical protein
MKDPKNIKKGKIDPNSTEFMKELESFLESSSPKKPNESKNTTKIDMSENLESSDDFLKNKELTEKARNKPFSEKFYGKEPLTEDLKKKLKMMEYSEPIQMNSEPNIHKKGSAVSKYIENAQSLAGKERKREEIRASQAKLEKEVAEKKKLGLGKKLVSESLDKPSRFTRILKALGMRVGKAVPFVGAGLGAAASAQALAKGDKLGAALEAASSVDPTPISDIILAGKDIYDIATEKDEVKKTIEPVIKSVGGEPDMKPSRAEKLAGEKPSPDLEEMDNSVNYEDYLKKKKRQLGY